MILPRTRTAAARYHRHKVIAILVTFTILWVTLKLLPEGTLFGRLRPAGSGITPGEAFREHWSGVVVRTDALVEEVLPDSLLPGAETATLQRLRVRTPDGHPFTIVHDLEAGGRVPAAIGDTVDVRGLFTWTTAGGLVRAPGDSTRGGGWLRL